MSDTSKNLLRQQVKERLGQQKALTPEALSAFAERLIASECFADAPAVVGYIAIQREIPLDAVLAGALHARKRVFLPRYTTDGVYVLAEIQNLGTDLEVGHFRIPEPAPHCPETSALPKGTLWLIPGIAFDSQGHRLGRGGGFYDRLQARYPNGTAIGVCRDCQIVKSIPSESWDLPVHAIITPTRWISSRYDIQNC